MPELLRLLAGARVAQDHIAKHDTARVRFGLQLLLRLAVEKLVHRERKNVGHGVLISVFGVHFADGVGIDNGNVDFGVKVHLLTRQHTLRAGADQLTHAVFVCYLGLKADIDLMIHHFPSLRRVGRRFPAGFAAGLPLPFLFSYSAYALTMR